MRSIFCITVIISAVMLQAQTPIPKENLISYWTGEGNPGTGRRLDELGSNHLWDSPDSSDVTGKVGMATRFTGGNHLRTKLNTDTYASSIRSDGQEITYAGWIQVDSLQNNQRIASRWSRWAPAREFRLSYISSSGVLQLEWSDSANTSEQTIADDLTITADTWYFVAFGRSDSTSTIWLSVTPDTAAAPRVAVTQSPVPTNPKGNSNELWFGYDQIAKTNSYGMWDDWAVYNKTLTTDELTWLYNSGSGRTYTDFAYVVEPVMEFFHDMEQPEPARGRISYYSYSAPNGTLSTDQAASGNQSLKITGSWGQIQIFNDSNTDYWCTTDKCRVSMDIYMVTFVGSMLFQMDGKTTTVLTDLDTNEGIGVMFHSRDGERGFSFGSTRTSGYNLPLNQWVHIDYLRDRSKRAPENSVELYVDGELVLAAEAPADPYTPTPYVAKAWHHISVGNDRIEEPMYYMDNFEVSPEAKLPGDTTTTAMDAREKAPAGITVHAGPNPMHGAISFDAGNMDITGLTICDRTGAEITHVRPHGGSPVVWNDHAAPAGMYFYRIETADGSFTGSFIKTEK